MATRLRSASSAPGLHNNNSGSDSWASARPDSGMAPSLSLWVQLFFRSRHLQQTALTYKAHAIRVVRALAYILNIHTLLVLCVALLSVYFCLEMDIRWNMDFSLVATGTVFPLTFTISQAYARRERATVLIANLKASVVALYYQHRDWDQSDNYPASLGDDRSPWALKAKVLLVELMVSVRRFLTIRSKLYESTAERRLTALKHDLLGLFELQTLLDTDKDHALAKALRRLQRADPSGGHTHLADCYRALSMLSVMNEQLTMKAGYTRGGEGGLSRTNQYLRYIISNIEELRMIKEYRTPAMMRHACSLLFHIFAVILAPYFTHFCDTWIAQGHEEGTCVAGYMGATFYVLIVMLLLHCEQDLEDCFEESGLDDVFFTVDEEVDVHTAADKAARVLLTTRSSAELSSHMLHGDSPPPGQASPVPNPNPGPSPGRGAAAYGGARPWGEAPAPGHPSHPGHPGHPSVAGKVWGTEHHFSSPGLGGAGFGVGQKRRSHDHMAASSEPCLSTIPEAPSGGAMARDGADLGGGYGNGYGGADLSSGNGYGGGGARGGHGSGGGGYSNGYSGGSGAGGGSSNGGDDSSFSSGNRGAYSGGGGGNDEANGSSHMRGGHSGNNGSSSSSQTRGGQSGSGHGGSGSGVSDPARG